jgi:hypothetical protein
MSEEAWRRTSRAAPYHFGSERAARPRIREPWEHALYAPEQESDEAQYKRLKREDELGNTDEIAVGSQTWDDGPEDWSQT